MVEIENNQTAKYILGSFVKEISELVEIIFYFTDPKDSSLSITKQILMNITQGHCDDLEDDEDTENDTIVLALMVLDLLSAFIIIVKVVFLTVKGRRAKLEQNEGTTIALMNL